MDRDELERVLCDAQRMEAIGQIAFGIVHDFKNALAVGYGHAQVLRRRIEEEAPQSREHVERLERILQATDRAVELSNILLSLSRPAETSGSDTRLAPMLGQVTRLVSRFPSRCVRFQMEVDDKVCVRLSAVELHQLVYNILTNAMQASPDEGRVFVTAGFGADCSEALISIRDQGPGVPAEQLERVFEPFYTTRPGATGLGLTVVRRIVSRAGGEIRVLNEEEGGLTVIVRLPAVPSQPVRQGPSALHALHLKVLVVEPDEMVRGTLVAVLEMLGCQTMQPPPTVMPYSSDSDQRPDVVLLSAVPGRETAAVRQLAAEVSDVPVVLLLGWRAGPEVSALLSEGLVAAFLEKPVGAARLWETLAPFRQQRKSPH